MMNVLRRMLHASIVLAAVAALSLKAEAGSGFDFTGGMSQTANLASVGGFEFEVTSAVTVSGLGFWDEGANGLVNRHDVGLWTAGGLQLAVTTVFNGGTTVASTSSDGQWIYSTSIPPLVLQPGIYVVGATYAANDADVARITTDWTSAPGLTYIQARQGDGGSLALPTVELGPAGLFGPNILVTPLNVVPEPSMLAPATLGAMTVFGLFARRRLNRDQVA